MPTALYTDYGMERDALRVRLLLQMWSSPHLCTKFTYSNRDHVTTYVH